MPHFEAGVDGRQETRPVGAFCRLGSRHHMVLIDAQRGFLGSLPGDGAVERAAQRIQVRPGALQAAVGGVLLVRRVAGLDDARHGAGHLGDRPPRGAEVEQHRRAVGTHDDVVGGDVAMQEVFAVHHLQRVEQRGDDRIELLLRRRPAQAAQPILEALALLEAHHHVGGGVRLEHARDAHHAGVLETCKRAGFLQEVGAAPLERFLVPVGLRHHAHGGVAVAEIEGVVLLDGDLGGEIDVLGLVGDAEAARPHHALDAVAAVEQGIDR